MKFNDDEKEKIMIIDNDRKIYTSNEQEYDIAIIEVKSSDNFSKEDFLDIDDYLYKGENLNDIYQELKSIYLVHYPKGFKAKLSFGTIKNISEDNNELKHLSDTDEGSSGCPIFNLSNYKVIGVHKGDHKRFEFQVGSVLKNSIISFNSNKKNKFNLDLELIYNTIIRFHNEDPSLLYKKLNFLGEGSFDSAYRIENRRTCLIRALRITYFTSDHNTEYDKEIMNSANILKSLDHPNIVKIFEAFNFKKSFANANELKSFAMVNELCNGGELFEEIVNYGPFNESYSAYVMFQLISAINYLHNNYIMHGDLKPEHIVIANRDRNKYPTIKVIGFNCCKKFKKGEVQRKFPPTYYILKYFNKSTIHRGLVGSIYYMSPELLKKNYNEKCDLFACGNILYILLSGRPAFGGENDKEILENIANAKYDLKSNPLNKVSKNGLDLISKLLDKDYNKRISAQEALNHPWFKMQKSKELYNEIKDKSIINKQLNNIKNYKRESIIQELALMYLLHNFPQMKQIVYSNKIFNKIDENDDGKITEVDLFKYMSKFMGNNILKKEVSDIFKILDIGNKGFIGYEEFSRASIDKEQFMIENVLRLAFRFFDVDDNGEITFEDLQKLFNGNNNDKKVNDKEIKEIINEMSNDGKINFEKSKKKTKLSIQKKSASSKCPSRDKSARKRGLYSLYGRAAYGGFLQAGQAYFPVYDESGITDFSGT